MSRLLALAAACIALVACASSPSSVAPVAPSIGAAGEDQFTSLLQTGVSYDFEPTDGPEAAARQADLVVVGTIKDVVAGRSLPYGRSNNQANLVIAVQRVVKGQAADAVFVEVEQPAGVSLEDLRAAVPKGRVALFLDDRTGIVASGPETGRPAGSAVYTPMIDGFIIESGDTWLGGLVSRDDMSSSWKALGGFDELVKASESQGG